MADQAGQVNAIKRAWPSPKPPAVKAGTKKRGTSCTTDSVRLAEADNLIAGRSLGMVVLCAADVDRFRQGKGALTHPPQPISPALKTHATFLCSARPSRRFGQLVLEASRARGRRSQSAPGVQGSPSDRPPTAPCPQPSLPVALSSPTHLHTLPARRYWGLKPRRRRDRAR